MKKKNLYGYLGFLSLLGLIGIFTEERSFLAFFAFSCLFWRADLKRIKATITSHMINVPINHLSISLNDLSDATTLL